MKIALERLFWLGFALLALVSVVAGFRNGLRLVDFQWLPVRILANGENPYLYSLNHVLFMDCQVDANQVPSCLALLSPFAFLPRWTANAIWDVCNLGFTGIFLFFVWKLWFRDVLGRKLFWLVALAFLFGTPWRVLIGNGQHLMFSLAFFIAAYYALLHGYRVLAGLLLAVSLFKYTTIAPLCFIFLFRKEWKTIGICAAIHIILTLGCGVYLHENPLTLVLQSLKVGGMLLAMGCADVASLMRSLGAVDVGPWATGGYVLYGILCFIVVVSGRRDELLKLSLLAIISNVMFYHRCYDLVTLVFPFVLLLRDWHESGRWNCCLRCIILLNLLWFFVLSAVFCAVRLASYNTLICFLLQHLLLMVLFVNSFQGKDKTRTAERCGVLS